MKISAAECPSDQELNAMKDKHCHTLSGLINNELCEADAVDAELLKASGITHTNVNNCGEWDIFKCVLKGKE